MLETLEQKDTIRPPDGVHTWDLSLNRSNGLFRWRLADDWLDPKTGRPNENWSSELEAKAPTWHCDKIAGEMYVLHADPNRFHMSMRGELLLEQGMAQTYSPYGDELEEMADWEDEHLCELELDPVPEIPPGTGIRIDFENVPTDARYWRLCADKSTRRWRLRDDTQKEHPILWEVRDYRGLLNLLWQDHGTHVFHQGPVSIDERGIARFFIPGFVPDE